MTNYKATNEANKALDKINHNQYRDHVPVGEMVEAIKEFGFEVVEDFILCGHEGKATIELKRNEKPSYLHISWYRMPSNRFETVAYIG